MATSNIISNGTERRRSLPALILIAFIKLYRLTLSPFISFFAGCRFHPTCSQYGLDAINRYGAFRGSWLTLKRILRCNPFSPGGYDPVE